MTLNQNGANELGNSAALWSPFAQMHTVSTGERLTIVRASDVWVWDAAGKQYFDGTASLWYCNVGHGRREIIDAIADQLENLDAYQIFGDFANEPALLLADMLAQRAPLANGKVFFTSGGGDSIDTAAKLARTYFSAIGQPQRTVLLHREHSYHGMHGFGTALSGIRANNLGAPYVPDVACVPHNDASALERTIIDVGPERVAAFFCEPIIGAGGVIPPDGDYLAEAAAVCRRHGVLFIADAVICGFGRLGNWFGIERFGVQPDIIVFAKGVTSGYQPLGGVIVAGHVAEPFWSPSGPVFRHGQTYAGHPAACAAGIATVKLLESDALLERAQEMEEPLAVRLRLLADHPLIDQARCGTGFIGALAFDADRLARTPTLPGLVAHAARRHGVLIRPMVAGVAFSPPLTATEKHLDLMTDAVLEALNEVHSAC
jgi:putrescine---pyruvate transaminase